MFKIVLAAFLLLNLSGTGSVLAADQNQERDQFRIQLKDQDMDQDRLRDQDRLHDADEVYGSQLMTDVERREYRQQMQMMKTEEEREQFRMRHHEKMKVRAKQMGKEIPDLPIKGMNKGYGGSSNGGGGRGK